VPFDGGLTVVMVGAVLSIFTGVEVNESDTGPFVEVTVPYTELASTLGIKVPSPQELTVSVKVVPEAPLIEKEHPVAEPAFAKSEFETELTF
jgi:hypothetical protein